MITSDARVLITGGSGFLGGALCRALQPHVREVIAVSRKTYPHLESQGIRSVACDLSDDITPLMPLLETTDVVFHVAARVEMWGSYQSFYDVNVKGTQELLNACRHQGVKGFVYTSSPSVIANGRDLQGVDESIPYPSHYNAFYPMTKADAERRVLAADTPEGMRTLSLRPHLIWGPGDTNLIPTILSRAEQGRLIKIGAGTNRVDTTFITDCVDAHLCAARALATNPAACGRAYFISQGEPVSLWDWINDILLVSGYEPVRRRLPLGIAKMLASMCEFWASRKGNDKVPLLTRFLVEEMATDHFFNISAARELLGYTPRYSITDAMQKTFGSAAQPQSQLSYVC